MFDLKILLLSVLSFLLGSIPTGLIIAVRKGIDPRTSGSGNIGATNVLRTAGKWPAFFTLAGDLVKGVVAMLIARYMHVGQFYEGIIGICAVLGHNYSVFLRFRGGKGVATSLGVLSVYSPQTALITIIIWLMTVVTTKYSSLGAIVSFTLLPLIIFLLDSKEKLLFAFLIMILLLYRHRDNISRILKGTEPRVGKTN